MTFGAVHAKTILWWSSNRLWCTCLIFVATLIGQDITTDANPYKMEWRRHFEFSSGLVPVGTADEHGTLWLITHPRPGWRDDELTKIDSNGQLASSYRPILPLKPIEWVSYLSPAVSGQSVGLLASLTSGGQQQTFEGAFFVPVVAGGLGTPVRIASAGPQFPNLIGAGADQFIAAGDQEPLTLLKVDSEGRVHWRNAFSRRLVLPAVSVGDSGNIFVVSQGGAFILLQVLDSSGRVLRSKRIPAKQGTVVADHDGGCSLLFTTQFHGEGNRVYLRIFDNQLRSVNQVETSLVGWGGRTYQLITTPRGHLVVGEGPERYKPNAAPKKVIAEFHRSGTLLWQQEISSVATPLLVPFGSGFYIVRDAFQGNGMEVEKYVY